MSAVARFIRRYSAASLAADALKWCRSPRLMHRLMEDARATREEAAFLREYPAALQNARKVLILSMADGSYSVKLECMLALGLLRRQWHVCVLTSNAYSHAKRLFASYGITDLVAFERLVWNPSIYRQFIAETARGAAGPMDFASVLQWTYGDAWIGPHILSSISRKTHSGAPDPSEPAVRAELLKQLPVALGFVHAAEHYLAEN